MSPMLNKKQEQILRGRGISEGISIGNAFIYKDILLRELEGRKIGIHQVTEEFKRIQTAVEQVVHHLRQTAQQVKKEFGQKNADIFTTQIEMLMDSTIHQQFFYELKKEMINAEQVVRNVLQQIIHKFHSSNADKFYHIGDDILDLKRRVLRKLIGIQAHTLETSRHSTLGMVGRENRSMDSYFEDTHPSILRLLEMVLSFSSQLPITLCGELAANEKMIPSLIEMGFRTLSVAPLRVPKVKK